MGSNIKFEVGQLSFALLFVQNVKKETIWQKVRNEKNPEEESETKPLSKYNINIH